jgi:hypothetical protein
MKEQFYNIVLRALFQMLLVIGVLVFSLVFVRIRGCARLRNEARREAGADLHY